MPTLNRKPRTTSRIGAVLAGVFLVAMLLPGAVLAAVDFTAATGGSAISADTAAASPGTGTYTSLAGPTVTEGAAGDLAAGTIVLDAPSGFTFLAGSGTASKNAPCTLVLSSVAATSDSITLTITGTSTATACVITFSGIQVRPTVGTPLQNGQITNTGTTGPGGNWGTLTEVEGSPILTFQTQPSATADAGVVFAQQPVVRVLDRFNNPRDDQVTLSISSGTGAPGAALTCTANPVTANSSGIATFAGCKIDKSSATAYTLRAVSTAGGSAAVSSGISILPGTPTKLGFVVQPARGTPGVAFAVQPQVAVLDANNNIVHTESGRSISLAIQANPGSGTLTCTANPVSTGGGVAAFSNCRISTIGVGRTLRATASGLASADSSAFDVADRVVFTTDPSTSSTAGVAFATQPVVAVRAGTSTTASNDTGTVVTLSLKPGTGAAGAALTCDSGLSRTVAGGVAAFTGCRIDKVSPVSPSSPYVIVVSASGLSSDESTNVTVNPGAAAKLTFTAQPTAATSSQPFSIQPVVAVQDLGGNTVTSGTNSNATVTLAIGSNPAGGTLTCTGGLTRVAVAGVATFSGCAINNAGVGYTLTATATGLTGATTSAFTVGAPVASITLTTSAPVSPGGLPTITWGGGIILTTQFGANGGNKTFKLQATRDNVTWFDIGPLFTTDTAGRSQFAFRPSTNFFYRAVFAGTPDLSAGTSPSVRTVVRQIALLRPTNGGATKSISRNTSITFFTVVRPSRPELTPAKVTFSFYRLSGSTWVLSTQRTVTAAADGRAATTFTFSSSGQWYVRSMANPTTYNANSVMSTIERYSVN